MSDSLCLEISQLQGVRKNNLICIKYVDTAASMLCTTFHAVSMSLEKLSIQISNFHIFDLMLQSVSADPWPAFSARGEAKLAAG